MPRSTPTTSVETLQLQRCVATQRLHHGLYMYMRMHVQHENIPLLQLWLYLLTRCNVVHCSLSELCDDPAAVFCVVVTSRSDLQLVSCSRIPVSMARLAALTARRCREVHELNHSNASQTKAGLIVATRTRLRMPVLHFARIEASLSSSLLTMALRVAHNL